MFMPHPTMSSEEMRARTQGVWDRFYNNQNVWKRSSVAHSLRARMAFFLPTAVLEGCVLEIINRGETYGYEITRRLNALGFTDVVEGTVYTILVRLEKNKLVDIEKKTSDMGPPRKFFVLNEAGRKELRKFWEKWEFVASKIHQLKEEVL